MGMHNFRELKIWKRSMDFAENLYTISLDFPVNEKFGLTAQIRSCAVSIPSNIAEGAGRSTNKQFRYFLEIAMGSCNELQTQLELAFRFKYIREDIYSVMISEASQIFRMLLAFYNSLSE